MSDITNVNELSVDVAGMSFNSVTNELTIGALKVSNLNAAQLLKSSAAGVVSNLSIMGGDGYHLVLGSGVPAASYKLNETSTQLIVSGAILNTGGGRIVKKRYLASSTTTLNVPVLSTDYHLIGNTNSGYNINFNLPAGIDGTVYKVTGVNNNDCGKGDVLAVPAGSGGIFPAESSIKLAPSQTVTLTYDSTLAQWIPEYSYEVLP